MSARALLATAAAYAWGTLCYAAAVFQAATLGRAIGETPRTLRTPVEVRVVGRQTTGGEL